MLRRVINSVLAEEFRKEFCEVLSASVLSAIMKKDYLDHTVSPFVKIHPFSPQ